MSNIYYGLSAIAAALVSSYNRPVLGLFQTLST